MTNPINDVFSTMASVVRFKPTVNLRFLVEELRRYGIKTNNQNDQGKTLFFQSAHLIQSFNVEDENNQEYSYPSYALVSFKDLFKIIGKNPDGVDEQDIVRVWVIAEKLEKRRMIEITGTSKESLGPNEDPDIPSKYANLHHIHRNNPKRDEFIYKSKFATNKKYITQDGHALIGVSDFFVLG